LIFLWFKVRPYEWYKRGLSLWGYEIGGANDANIAAERKLREEALECFRRGLEHDPDHSSLLFCIGCAYFVDGEPAGDSTEAISWWRKAAEQGDANACLHLRAIKGDPAIQHSVGYTWGHYASFGAISWAQAFAWYSKSAKRGNGGAQYNVAWHYEKGEAVARDLTEAAKWYRKAAEQGFPRAQYELACMYYHGVGVPQDYAEAAVWFQKVAEADDVDDRLGSFRVHSWQRSSARLELGNIYSSGQGVPQDYGKSSFWYRKAAEQTNE
jgi:TPR repeat protein